MRVKAERHDECLRLEFLNGANPAIDGGMLTLRMDGWLKVMKGVTNLEQVVRETSV